MKKYVTTAALVAAVAFGGGYASAQSATQEAKDKTKTAAKKTGDAVETGAKKTGDAVETGAKKTADAVETGAKKTGQATEKGAKKTAAVVTDAEITSAVKTKMAADKTVGATKINVDTNNGVVTLTGTVDSAAEHTQALHIARTTKGVKHVEDKLTVGKTAATSGHDETKIVIKDDTTPMVKKGAEKTADAAKKVGEATEHGAKKTVNAVKNTDVKVKDDTHVEIHKDDGDPAVKTAGEATADAGITSAVKTKLLADSRVSGLKIDVDTSKGVVTLTGNVASAEERAAALDLARTTKGVTRVVDKLTLK